LGLEGAAWTFFRGTGLANLGAPVVAPAAPEKKSDEVLPAAPPDAPAQSGWTGAAFWSSFATQEEETNGETLARRSARQRGLGAPAAQPLEDGGDIESRESLLGG
jgi:hypothetical protein